MKSLLTTHYLNNPHYHFSKREMLIGFGLFLLLWALLFFRGMYMPLMHDESATFFYYVQTGVVFPPEAHYDANNHFLNSLLAHYSFKIFGASSLAIRLPSILSFALYCYGINGISGRLKNGLVRWGLQLTLLTGVFIFEYFAECRGYALCLAFLVAAIYHFMLHTESNKLKHLILCGILLWFSAFANLTTLVSAAIIFVCLGTYSVLILHQNIKSLLSRLLILALLASPFLILAQWSFKLKELGLLYYGSLDGLFKVTVHSLSERFLGFHHPLVNWLVVVVFFASLVALALLLIQSKKLKIIFENRQLLLVLLIGSISMIILLAQVLQVNYPEDRAGIYLFIYFFGAVAFLLDRAAEKKKQLQWTALIFGFFPVYFILQISIRQTTFVTDERSSQPIFEKVLALENDHRFPLTVGGYITQELNWYMMSNMSGENLGRLHWSNHPGLDADIQLVANSRKSDQPLLEVYYDSIYHDKAAELTLYKRKNYLRRNLISTHDVTENGELNVEYFTLFEEASNDLIGKTLYIGIEGNLTSNHQPFNARFVAAVDDTIQKNNLAYEYIQLDWLKYDWQEKDENNLLVGTLIHDVPEQAHKIAFYLWNPKQSSFRLSNGKCYLYEIVKDY